MAAACFARRSGVQPVFLRVLVTGCHTPRKRSIPESGRIDFAQGWRSSAFAEDDNKGVAGEDNKRKARDDSKGKASFLLLVTPMHGMKNEIQFGGSEAGFLVDAVLQ